MADRWAVLRKSLHRPRANHAFWRPAAKRMNVATETETPLCSKANGYRRHIFASMNSTTKGPSMYEVH